MKAISWECGSVSTGEFVSRGCGWARRARPGSLLSRKSASGRRLPGGSMLCTGKPESELRQRQLRGGSKQ